MSRLPYRRDGLRPPPRRRFGQNFLVDSRAARRIVDALDPRPGERVLEIGPGRGALTAVLLERLDRVVGVEIDRDLARELRARFGSRLALLERDFLKLDLGEVASSEESGRNAPLVVVGNLPFNISKPVAGKLVRDRRHVERAVLTFQREVALRVTAAPGGRDYGPLSVLVSQTYDVRRLFDLAPAAFRPRPRVLSTVTLWRALPADELPQRKEAALRSCLAASFARRRQTLFNNLRQALPGGERQAREVLDAAEIDGGLRAEALSPREFRRMADHWPGSGRAD